MSEQPRISTPTYGFNAAMGYRFRARIRSRKRVTWLGFGKTVVEFQFVLEREFGGTWEYHDSSIWFPTKEDAIGDANRCLDRIEWNPVTDQEYV